LIFNNQIVLFPYDTRTFSLKLFASNNKCLVSWLSKKKSLNILCTHTVLRNCHIHFMILHCIQFILNDRELITQLSTGYIFDGQLYHT